MTDDPDIAAMRAWVDGVDRLIRSTRGRVLTPEEHATLRTILAGMAELRGAVTFELEPSEAAAVRRLLGPTPTPDTTN